MENAKSNKDGKIDVAFKKSLPPGKYKVRFALKNTDDISFEKSINENVSFKIQQKTHTEIEIPIFLFETMTLRNLNFEIAFDNNCSSFSGIYVNPEYYQLNKIPVDLLQPQTLHFDISSKDNKQHESKEGVLFKFSMKLDIDCIEREIYISNSYINGLETKNIGFFQNKEYSHVFSLKHE